MNTSRWITTELGNAVKKLLVSALAGAGLLVTPTSYAKGMMFVPASSNDIFYNTDFKLLPTETRDGGVDVKDVDAFINRNRGMRSSLKTCYIGFLKPDEIVSPDREMDASIKKILAEYPGSFDQSWQPVEGKVLRARIAALEGCDGDYPVALSVIVTDEAGKVIDVDALNWRFMRLSKGDDGSLAVFGCFYCGEVVDVHYDAGRNRIYYEWAGH